MKLWKRLYEDYFKPSRLRDYQLVLETAFNLGYKMVSISQFHNMVVDGNSGGCTKILVNRHDIDTSPKVAAEFFYIEKSIYGMNGSATYYFRNSTIDENLIRAINLYGYETGYHYEELATFEKKSKMKNKDMIMNALPQMREIFLDNLNNFRIQTGSVSLSVASHGDFINTKHGLPNSLLLNDAKTRTDASIIVEAYDRSIMDYVNKRYADQVLLDKFAVAVISSLKEGTNILMILTHPRNWKVDCFANSKDNLLRIKQEIAYMI